MSRLEGTAYCLEASTPFFILSLINFQPSSFDRTELFVPTASKKPDHRTAPRATINQLRLAIT